MKHAKWLWGLGFALLVAGPLIAQSPARHLPIADFVSVQALNTTSSWCTEDGSRCLSFDAFGKRAVQQGLDFGTTVDGTVLVRPLNDGKARVSVVMTTNNALCWGSQWNEDLGTFAVAFGYNPPQVKAGSPASLGNGLTKVEFLMPSPDSPLPSFRSLVYTGLADYPLLSIQTQISCEGLLRFGTGYPDNTPGKAHLTEVALFEGNLNRGICQGGDCWPAELIQFWPANVR